jgi:GNAT superfamily N-acetyltransferase
VNDKDVLIGFATHLYHGHSWEPEPRCDLIDLFILSDQRGKGTGRALIEAVYQEVDSRGCSSVCWLIQNFNLAGRAL